MDYKQKTAITKKITKIPQLKSLHIEISTNRDLHILHSKTCVKWPHSKRQKNGFQDQLSLNAGQKYCRMHSAILSTLIKLPIVIKIFVLSIFEWPFYTGFIVG